MTIELTESQRQAIREHPASPIVLRDPATEARYVLIPAQMYGRMRALFTDDAFAVEEAYALMDQVAMNEGWNDPALDAYERVDPRKKQ